MSTPEQAPVARWHAFGQKQATKETNGLRQQRESVYLKISK